MKEKTRKKEYSSNKKKTLEKQEPQENEEKE